jgi:transmembrane protein 231
MLKGGWIQWVATFVVLWWLLQWAEWFAFTNKFVTVRVVSDLQPKNQRF